MAGKLETAKYVGRKIVQGVRVFGGVFVSPIDSLWGVVKGGVEFCRSPKKYIWGTIRGVEADPHDKYSKMPRDDFGRFFTFTFAGSRIATVVVATLCILGFIGAIAAPLPGIAPLYAAGVGAALKAMGITIAWSSFFRVIGSAIGACIDATARFFYPSIWEISSRLNFPKMLGKAFLAASFVGECFQAFKKFFGIQPKQLPINKSSPSVDGNGDDNRISRSGSYSNHMSPFISPVNDRAEWQQPQQPQDVLSPSGVKSKPVAGKAPANNPTSAEGEEADQAQLRSRYSLSGSYSQ